MPSNALHGRFGTLRFSTSSTATTSQTKVAELRNYTLTVEGDTIDVSNHDPVVNSMRAKDCPAPVER